MFACEKAPVAFPVDNGLAPLLPGEKWVLEVYVVGPAGLLTVDYERYAWDKDGDAMGTHRDLQVEHRQGYARLQALDGHRLRGIGARDEAGGMERYVHKSAPRDPGAYVPFAWDRRFRVFEDTVTVIVLRRKGDSCPGMLDFGHAFATPPEIDN